MNTFNKEESYCPGARTKWGAKRWHSVGKLPHWCRPKLPCCPTPFQIFMFISVDLRCSQPGHRSFLCKSECSGEWRNPQLVTALGMQRRWSAYIKSHCGPDAQSTGRKRRVEWTHYLEDGNQSCQMLSSGHGAAVPHITSQELYPHKMFTWPRERKFQSRVEKGS